MLQNPRQQTQKQAEKAKSCMKILNGKKTKHRRLNEFKSYLNPENKTCHKFVKLNKRKIFEKSSIKILEYVNELGNKGINFSFLFYFNVLVLFLYGMI